MPRAPLFGYKGNSLRILTPDCRAVEVIFIAFGKIILFSQIVQSLWWGVSSNLQNKEINEINETAITKVKQCRYNENSLYLCLGSNVVTWKLECYNDIGVHTKKNDKHNKIDKRYQLLRKQEKLEFTSFVERRLRGNQIETFKSMEFLIMVEFFSVFRSKMEIYCHDRFQKVSL